MYQLGVTSLYIILEFMLVQHVKLSSCKNANEWRNLTLLRHVVWRNQFHTISTIVGNLHFLDTHKAWHCICRQHGCKVHVNTSRNTFENNYFFWWYIIGMTKHGILFRHDTTINLTRYVDVDWARDLKIQWSTFGMIFKFGSTLLMWSSKLQPMVEFSNIESKYQPLRDGAKEIIWLRSLYSNLQILNSGPIVMFANNQNNIKLVKNPIFHTYTKHTKI